MSSGQSNNGQTDSHYVIRQWTLFLAGSDIVLQLRNGEITIDVPLSMSAARELIRGLEDMLRVIESGSTHDAN